MSEHIPSFIDTDKGEVLLSVLQALVPWSIFGPSPNSRQVYRWDDRTPSPLCGILSDMVHRLERERKVTVKGVFLNLYQDGKDYCPYHRDMYGTDVYTISLGATRDLLIKPDNGDKTIKYSLRSGDLYYMSKAINSTHRHSIPKRKNVNGTRISIVFFTVSDYQN
jgi:alkylated DNA repair dioxygenase AlkB